MSQNLDPEAIDKFNESLRELNNSMPSFILGLSQAAGVASGSLKASEALDKLSNKTKELTALEEAEAAVKKKLEIIEANRTRAQSNATDALQKFAHGLTDTSTEFSKFNGALGSAGNAAFEISKNFGLLGMAVGGLIKATTMVAQAATKQADNALKATDEFNKMGAAGGLTAKTIAEMGIKIGLSNEQFGLMPKALKRAGDSITSLGASTADGQKKLMGMLAVTNEQREAFQRLGIGQEELMERQSDYVALQKASGMQLVGNMRTEAGLQKASLEYTKNLLVLADITGQDVDSVAAQQKQAQAAYEIQLDNFRIANEIKKAEKDTSEEGKKRLEQLQNEKKSRDATLAVVSSIGDQDLTAGLQKFFATGAITEQSAMYAQLGIDMQGFRKRMQEGEDISGEFANALRDATQKKVEEVGTAAAFNKEVGKVFNLTEKTLAWTAANAETDFKAKKKNAEASVGTPDDKKGKTGKTSEEDPAQKARNALTTTTIEINRVLEKTLLAGSPLMSGFNALTIATTALTAAAGVAAIALGAMAAKSAINKTLETAGNIGGSGAGGGILDRIFGSGSKDSGSGTPSGTPSGTTGNTPKSKNRSGRVRTARGRVTKSPVSAVPASVPGVAGGEAGSKVMAMIGDAGPALAKLGPGVGEGAAGFLKAFANPQVVLGAAGLGASIAAMIATIGAGIAGASWIMGKALPTLMEGIQSFEKLDGQKLSAAGTGILDLGKGLAVFGVGGAAAGIGNIAQNMSDGITAFFGGKTPIDKLVEFSKLDIDGPKTKSNAEAFVAFGEAMAKTGLGTASSGIGNLAGNIADGINKIFGKKDAIEKFVEFSKLQVDPKKTKEMAEAFRAYAEGINVLSSSPSTGSKPSNNATTAPPATAPATSTTATPATNTAKPATATSTTATPATNTEKPTATPATATSTPTTNTAKPTATSTSSTNSSSTLNAMGSAALYGGPAVKPTVGSAPTISFPSMGSSGTDGGVDGKTGTGTSDAPKVATAKGSVASLDEKAIKDMIIKHEGKVNKPYKDSLGLWTVGVGHLIGDGKSLPDAWNREFSDAEIMKLFDEDYDHHRKAAESIPGFDKFNSAGQGALTDLTFNMGPSWFKRFPNTSKQIEKGNAEGAAAGLQDSKWYTQVGKRAAEVVGLISQGGIQAKDGGIADGPIEGYPATLHGNEAILPLNPDSILTKLSKMSVSELEKESTTNTTSSSSTTENVISSNTEMIELMKMFIEKMDDFIDAQSDSNSIQSELLMYSKV